MDPRKEELIAALVRRGIRSRAVLDAIARVRREDFAGVENAELAYTDNALSIAEGQTISQPYVVALMTEALELEPGMRVLEVGTGSGYHAAVLDALGAEVFSIERNERLAETARERLRGTRVRVFLGDGSLGLPAHAPFDRILVTAGAPRVPEALFAQLTVGGILVIPVRVGPNAQEADEDLRVVSRPGQASFTQRSLGPVRFVPLTGRDAWGSEAEGRRAPK